MNCQPKLTDGWEVFTNRVLESADLLRYQDQFSQNKPIEFYGKTMIVTENKLEDGYAIAFPITFPSKIVDPISNDDQSYHRFNSYPLNSEWRIVERVINRISRDMEIMTCDQLSRMMDVLELTFG